MPKRTMHVSVKRLILWPLSAMAACALLVISVCHIYDLPSPAVILALATNLVPPSKSYQLFDFEEIPAANATRPYKEAPIPLAVSTEWRDGLTVSLEQFLALTKTKAFLVVHDDQLVVENYYGNAKKNTLFPSYSVSKSLVSALVGVAVKQKKISVHDELGMYTSNFSLDERYRNIHVDDLLNMRSGIDLVDDYTTLWAPIVKMYLTTDLDKFISQINGLRFSPGSQFEYRSVDSQVLGRALSQATGMSISSYMARELWAPLGAEFSAKWNVDSSAHNVEKTFCCFNATARDFAKIGSLYLHQGEWDGQQLLDRSWVESLSSPIELDVKRSLGYSNNWWIPPDNSDGDYSAIGIHGQFIYVNPRHRTVIVKLSEHEAEQDVLLTLATFQRIARQLDKAKSP